MARMKLTRRSLLKAGAAGAAAGLVPRGTAATLAGLNVAADTSMAAEPQTTTPPAAAGRERLLLDYGWRFALGNADEAAKDFGFGAMRNTLTFAKATNVTPAAGTRFDDSSWQAIDLPHDWAIDLPFQNDPGLPAHGGKPLGRAYPATSIGWYRRTFPLPASDGERRLALEFDGVFRDAMVFLNGQYIGENASGYAPFRFDITDFARYGGDNVLCVRVNATLGEGWFYEGAGIYRHVWLVKTAPVHLAAWGTAVRAEQAATAWPVTVSSEVENHTAAARLCRLRVRIQDAKGGEVASFASEPARVQPNETATLTATARVHAPALWSLESPHVHRGTVTLEAEGAAVDAEEIPFGFRTARFDANRGFLLNGTPVKIKGTCNHQDHAGVGAALPDALQAYRIRILQGMGSNGCRTSHNPPTPAFLDACDQLGMVVMCETRMMSSTPEGMSQLERMVRRFRNHPSIVLWSMGNEEPEQGTPTGARVVASMKERVRQLDPTRPVTAAQNGGWSTLVDGQPTRPGVSGVVDAQGCNYNEQNIDAYHAAFPATPIFGSETASAVATRGIYFTDKERGYVTAYDTNVPGSYAKTAEAWWKFYAQRPWLAGGFAWTGFDYRGEPSPYQWPCISSHFGIVDTCGFPKDTYFYYKAWWGDEPVLHLFPHWNWAGREGQPIAVWCHSNLDTVELFVNGTSVGSQPVPRNGHVEWNVPYAAGTLEARGSRNGRVVLTDRRATTGAAAGLKLSADRTQIQADRQDVACVAVSVVDANGATVPTAANLVQFAVTGPGRIIGVGNGDPSSHESDRGPQRSAFNGLAMCLVQALADAGTVEVRASADGLTPATITITTTAAPAVPSL